MPVIGTPIAQPDETPDDPTPDQILEANLGRARSIDVDGTRTDRHSLPDQIQAAEYLKKQQLTANPNRPLGGVRFFKMNPGGTF